MNPDRLSKEMIDALRIEAQGQTPAEREIFVREIGEANQRFIGRWRHFIREPEADDEIAERIIAVGDVSDVSHAWDGERSPNNPAARADLLHEVIFYDKGSGQGAAEIKFDFLKSDSEQMKDFMKEYGLKTEESAIEKLREIEQYATITHEIAHKYQNILLPRWFGECGAYYYELGGVLSKYNAAVFNPTNEARADFYAELLDRHGKRAHELFFGDGTSSDDMDILSDITNEELEKLKLPEERS